MVQHTKKLEISWLVPVDYEFGANNLPFSPHFATIVSDPPDCGDVLLGEGHPVLLTQGLVLLNGYCAVSTEVKLLKNIVKC